jgi:hypothetical protein
MISSTLVFLRMVFFALALVCVGESYGDDAVNELAPMIEALRNARHANERVSALEALRVAITVESVEARVNECDIMTIAAHLSDEDKEVVQMAAIVLGEIGPQAKLALPALEASMARLESEESERILKPSQPYATEIYVALNKIDGRPMPMLRSNQGSEHGRDE